MRPDVTALVKTLLSERDEIDRLLAALLKGTETDDTGTPRHKPAKRFGWTAERRAKMAATIAARKAAVSAVVESEKASA